MQNPQSAESKQVSESYISVTESNPPEAAPHFVIYE